MSTVKRAREIAILAHEGQSYGTAGMPYFAHVEAVALMVSTPDEIMVAYLHDVIEDTTWTQKDLVREGFSREVINAVMRLTHDKDRVSYTEYILKLAKDPLARRVKQMDLISNIDAMLINPATVLKVKYQAALALLDAVEDLENATV